MTRKLPGRTEAQEQQLGIQLLKLHGYRVWRIGQRDARGTQDPGVPDCVAIHPKRGLLWVEFKRETGGRQSAAQKAFEAACRTAGVRYVCGNLEALKTEIEIRAQGVAA